MTFRTIHILRQYHILAEDGDAGKAYDFLFDDMTWTIRYLVVDTGHWLTGYRVLILPQAIKHTNIQEKQLILNLTKTQIQNSPGVEADKPVSLQQQIDLHDYYAYPYFWTVSGFSPGYPFPVSSEFLNATTPEQDEAKPGDPHLRSTNEVTGYHIHASDGEIGHVEDFIVDETTWAIEYMAVDTKNWLPGRKVLVTPRDITRVIWDEHLVMVSLSQRAIKNSPEFSPAELMGEDDI